MRQTGKVATPATFQSQEQVLFCGLRVRMGIATGTLAPGSSVRTSSVLDMAKGAGVILATGAVVVRGPDMQPCLHLWQW